jgi:hypothetical protein
MSLTIDELKERLSQEYEVDLLEMLQLDSSDLVEILEDYIIDHQDELRDKYDESQGQEDTEYERLGV